MNKQTAVSR